MLRESATAVCGKRILGSGNNRDRGPEALAPSGPGATVVWLAVEGHSLLTFHFTCSMCSWNRLTLTFKSKNAF